MNIDNATVVVDFTTKCNCLCPGCGRTKNGKLNPDIPIADMSLNTFKKFFSRDVCNRINKVLFSPSYGDPPMNKNFIDSIKWVIQQIDEKKHKDKSTLPIISICTNGGNQSEEFWRELAQILKSKKLQKTRVQFAIDGLEDSNHLYRKGIKWEVLMRNAEAFISNGGNADWQFISFEHNIHQIEKAKKLSEKMGFLHFSTKTSRYKPAIYRDMFSKKQYDDKKIKHVDNEYKKTKQKVINKFNSEYDNDYNKYLNDCKVECRTFKEREIFFQFDGSVWPCCSLSNIRFSKKSVEQFENWAGDYDKNFNNINHYSLKEIINSDIFYRIEKGLKNKTTDSKYPRLYECSKHCGELFSRSS